MSHISNFQKQHGLTSDGVIGKQTLLKIKELLNIKSNEELANFMGQCDHESASFSAVVENLNYSADSLLKVFPKYFNKINVAKYHRQPEKIANHVYASRMGNGNELSGDGWKHRGFGFIQLTGKNNQEDFANSIDNQSIKETPELIATKYPFESAKYFFDKNNLWDLSKKIDTASITKLSKAINLGNAMSKNTPKGLDDRINKTKYYYNLINS